LYFLYGFNETKLYVKPIASPSYSKDRQMNATYSFFLRSQNTLLPSHLFLSSPSSRLRSPFLLRTPSSPHRVKPQHKSTARRLRSAPLPSRISRCGAQSGRSPLLSAVEAAPLGLPRCIATSRSRRSSTSSRRSRRTMPATTSRRSLST
jgi:hypothetical protein